MTLSGSPHAKWPGICPSLRRIASLHGSLTSCGGTSPLMPRVERRGRGIESASPTPMPATGAVSSRHWCILPADPASDPPDPARIAVGCFRTRALTTAGTTYEEAG
jgi:hypothetical protein